MRVCADVDDPRNTDNAWMETTAWHFHCDNETLAIAITSLLSADDDAKAFKAMWLDVDPVRSSLWTHLYVAS
jgi:ADP-ribose pyrophosphatase